MADNSENENTYNPASGAPAKGSKDYEDMRARMAGVKLQENTNIKKPQAATSGAIKKTLSFAPEMTHIVVNPRKLLELDNANYEPNNSRNKLPNNYRYVMGYKKYPLPVYNKNTRKNQRALFRRSPFYNPSEHHRHIDFEIPPLRNLFHKKITSDVDFLKLEQRIFKFLYDHAYAQLYRDIRRQDKYEWGLHYARQKQRSQYKSTKDQGVAEENALKDEIHSIINPQAIQYAQDNFGNILRDTIRREPSLAKFQYKIENAHEAALELAHSLNTVALDRELRERIAAQEAILQSEEAVARRAEVMALRPAPLKEHTARVEQYLTEQQNARNAAIERELAAKEAARAAREAAREARAAREATRAPQEPNTLNRLYSWLYGRGDALPGLGLATRAPVAAHRAEAPVAAPAPVAAGVAQDAELAAAKAAQDAGTETENQKKLLRKHGLIRTANEWVPSWMRGPGDAGGAGGQEGGSVVRRKTKRGRRSLRSRRTRKLYRKYK